MRKETELKFGMGHWARRSGTDGRQRIERFTADILASRTKRAMKKAKKLRKLDARQRGTVRGRTSLKGLQDHLGALNDIQVHQKLIPKLASGTPRTKRRQSSCPRGRVGPDHWEVVADFRALMADACRQDRHVGRLQDNGSALRSSELQGRKDWRRAAHYRRRAALDCPCDCTTAWQAAWE